jgi:hypothetical protein
MGQIKDCNKSAKKMARDIVKLLDTWSVCHLQLQRDVHAPASLLLNPLLLGAMAVVALIIFGTLVFLVHTKKLCGKKPVIYEILNTIVLHNIEVEG